MVWLPLAVYTGAFILGYVVGLTGKKVLLYCSIALPFLVVFAMENFPQLFSAGSGAYDSAPMFEVLYFTLAIPTAALAWLGFWLAGKNRNKKTPVDISSTKSLSNSNQYSSAGIKTA